MVFREQLGIRRLLLAVVVAAVFIKLADLAGLLFGVRQVFGMIEEGNSGWIAGAAWIGFAAAIWLGYAFWFGIVLPGSVERYWASRKLKTKRKEALMKTLEQFEEARESK